ncbi:MAG: hypothetical protein ACRENB_10455 [Gemmatimonadales bacterium]
MRLAAAAALAVAIAPSVEGQATFDRTRDRGPGVASSQFGTYIAKGQLFIYPYYEYYLDNNYEYKPQELGYVVDTDFRGRYRAHEWLLFLGYGISDRLALEVEAAGISAKLDKSANDPSPQPARLEQSGLGDVESQLRWRWRRESESRPEIYSYFETVFPFQKRKKLIGTSSWEFALGTGFIRGFRWGTMTARAAIGWAEGKPEPGEVAIEYLRRISRRLGVYAAVEGTEDEFELITEAKVFLARNVVLKLNSAVGLTSKAPGWAPEVGVMIWLP